jgi:hypothetical protein
MTSDYFVNGNLSDGRGGEVVVSPSGNTHGQRNNPLASKITSVLSTNYTDSDIRDALALLDSRGLKNTPEIRRQLRLQTQKDVIQSNGEIVREFGHVAEVRTKHFLLKLT